MTAIFQILSRLGALAFEPFWLPLIAWTALAAGVLLVLRGWRTVHPFAQCDVRSALLLALPAGVVLALLIEAPVAMFSESSSPVMDYVVRSARQGVATPTGGTLNAVPSNVSPALQLGLAFWLGLATLGAVLAATVRLATLIRDAFALRRFARSLRFVAPGFLGLGDRTDVQTRRTRYAVSRADVPPLTFGLLHPVVVIPVRLLEHPAELRMALAHEHIHVRRRDYLRQWAEQLVAAVFAVHPFASLLLRQIDEYRERACDAEVLADRDVDRQRYAALLYTAASGGLQAPLPSLQMARRSSRLRERVAAMETYGPDPRKLRRVRAVSVAVAAVLLLATASVVGGFDLLRNGGQDQSPAIGDGTEFVLQKPVIHIDGQVVDSVGTMQIHDVRDVSGLFLFARGYGLFTFSFKPIPGWDAAGELDGRTIRFAIGGHEVRVESKAPVLGGARRAIYAQHDSDFDEGRVRDSRGMSSRFLNTGFGAVSARDGFAFGHWDPITALYEEKLNPPKGLRIQGGTIRYGARIDTLRGSVATDDLSELAFIYLRGLGRVVFSGSSFEGAQQAAHVNGDVLTARTEELDLTIDADLPILAAQEGRLWMRYEPGYTPGNGADGSFGTARTAEELPSGGSIDRD